MLSPSLKLRSKFMLLAEMRQGHPTPADTHEPTPIEKRDTKRYDVKHM
jgi:hypothetical protein